MGDFEIKPLTPATWRWGGASTAPRRSCRTSITGRSTRRSRTWCPTTGSPASSSTATTAARASRRPRYMGRSTSSRRPAAAWSRATRGTPRAKGCRRRSCTTAAVEPRLASAGGADQRSATGADSLALAPLQPSTTTTALASAEALRHILADHQFPSLPVDVEESGSIVTSMSTARLRPRPGRGVL